MRTGPSVSLHSQTLAACCPMMAFAKRLLLLALFSGLIILAALPSLAQDEANPPPKAKDEEPVDPNALSAKQVQLPTEGVNYAAIADNKPLAGPQDNPAEWEAYKRVIAHVRQVPHSALEWRHRIGISYEQLAGEERAAFFRNLLLIRGKLVDLHKVEIGDKFKSIDLKELYEGWILQDGNPNFPIKIIVTELPEKFVPGEELDEPVEIDAYYFKRANCSGEKMSTQAAPKYAPIMIGRSFRVMEPEAPEPNLKLSEADQVRLPDNELFNSIRDKIPLASKSSPEGFDEYLAYNYVFTHVQKFSPEVFARHSRRDVVYADLINDVRQEYLRKLIHVEGRLVRLRERSAKEHLRHANVDVIYDGWIYHDEVKEHPIVVAFTELPEGIEPGERVSYQVKVDGFYFKLMGYKSQERDNKGKDVWRVAPLLVARAPTVVRDIRETYSWSGFMPLVMGIIGGVMVAALILTVWFRHGDRRTRARVRDTMLVNPFDNATPPVVQPGTAWGDLAEPQR